MKTVALGTSPLRVSPLCLGAMYFGTKTDGDTSFALLDQYVEAGGAFIDTANIYAHWAPGARGGDSESLLGRWMRARGNRDQVVIASKVGFDQPGVPLGLAAAQIEAECDKSLRRLGVDTIDLYYAHVDDRQTPQEETLEAFDRLVCAGKVRAIGASNFTAWRVERARCLSREHGWAEYVCIQQKHTYLRPRPGASFAPQLAVDEDLIDYCGDQHLTLLPYSPLLKGSYTRSDRPLPPEFTGADSDSRLAAAHAVARELDATPNQIVLAWMVAHGWVPVMAASTPEQLRENLGALNIRFSAAQLKRLDGAGA